MASSYLLQQPRELIDVIKKLVAANRLTTEQAAKICPVFESLVAKTQNFGN